MTVMAGNHLEKEQLQRLRHAEFYVGYVWAALALAIFSGFAIGAHMAFVIGFNFPLGKGFYSFIQTHGHVQLVGWAGLFIMGISLHFIPRLAGVPIVHPEWIKRSLWAVVIGLILRSFGHSMLPYFTTGSLFVPLRIVVATSGILEAIGIGVYLLLLIGTMRQVVQIGERPALKMVRPFFGMMLAGWAIYATLNAVLLIDMAWRGTIAVDQGWDRFAIQSFVGLVLLPVAFAFSVRMLPLYLRLAAPDWPVRTVAYAYLLTLSLQLLPGLPPFLGLQSRLPGVLSTLGSILKGGVVLWFIWNLDILTRRRDPWIVHRKLHPGPERRPTREGIPDYGEFGRFERLVYSAYSWLAFGALLELLIGIFSFYGQPLPFSADAVRHTYLLGFISMLILGMSVRMIPGFIKKKEVAHRSLVDATFWLGNAAVVGRVLPLLLPASVLSVVPGSVWLVQRAFGVSGILGMAAIICLAVNLRATAHRPE